MAWLAKGFELLSSLPFIPFGLAWGAAYVYSRNTRLSTLRAIDVTVLFLAYIVQAMFDEVFGIAFGKYLLLLLFLISFGLLGGLQMQIKGAFDPVKIIRSIWRLGFFVLSLLYLLLLIVGIAIHFSRS